MGGKAGVVVVNYMSHHLIKNYFADLTPDAGLQTVVVDNFSSEEERRAITALAEANGWTCIQNPNTGFGEGVNKGVDAAFGMGCEAVVVANPDLDISPRSVAELAAEALARPRSIVAPLVLDSNGRPWGQLGYVDVHDGRARSSGGSGSALAWVSGACIAVSAETWSDLGGFSTDYFMYWEDVDLSARCQRAGGAVVLTDQIRATHAVGGTQGERRSKVYYYYNCRNRLVFAARNLTRRQQLRWLVLTPSDIRRVARRDAGLTRWQRVTVALAPCVLGAFAGIGFMLRKWTEMHSDE